MIRDFYQWTSDKRLPLPMREEPENKPTIQEKQARAGIAHWAYPDGYVRNHYPDGWFMPRAADALQKMGKGRK